MCGRIFTSLAVISLLLCIASAATWVFSYLRPTTVTRVLTYDRYVTDISGGRLVWYATSWRNFNTPLPDPGWHVTKWQFPCLVWDGPRDWPKRHYHRIGGLAGAWGRDAAFLELPLSYATAALLVIPLIRFVPWCRRQKPGRCPICGYDLRATPDRCPECGTKVANAVG